MYLQLSVIFLIELICKKIYRNDIDIFCFDPEEYNYDFILISLTFKCRYRARRIENCILKSFTKSSLKVVKIRSNLVKMLNSIVIYTQWVCE